MKRDQLALNWTIREDVMNTLRLDLKCKGLLIQLEVNGPK